MTIPEARGEALLVLNSQLNVCAANRSFYELFRLAPEECIGKKVYEVGGRAWDGKLRLMLEAALKGGSRADHFELVHDEGTQGHGALWLSAKVLPASTPGEQTILLSIEDLNTERSPEDSLAVATADLQSFAELAGRSAHELNNILAVIRMNAELLQPDLAKHGLPVIEMQDIIDAAVRAETLTRKLLVSSRRAFPQPTGLDQSVAMTMAAAPDKEPEPMSEDYRNPLVPQETSSRPTILLVEDEKGLRKLTDRILTEAGYRVIEASDGAEALRVAAGEVGEIDLVLTDVEMPTLGGRGMVAELNELSPGIKVLFMSGYTDNEILRRGIRNEKTHFLQKPFTAGNLRIAVDTALREPATTES